MLKVKFWEWTTRLSIDRQMLSHSAGDATSPYNFNTLTRAYVS